jgi:phospholipid/cholesterol/gamma-HCH transport system substrate-binding protein
MSGKAVARLLALGAIAAGILVAVVVLTGGSSYTIHATFQDAGQLVKGDLVEVAGRSVGHVTNLSLTRNGQADVELTIDDDDVAPLHHGTIASIHTVGLASIANRFVELSPGPPDAEAMPDGAVLPATNTRGIVDLDVLFDSAGPQTRARFKRILRQAGSSLSGDTPKQLNAGLHYLDPAFSQITSLSARLLADKVALARLIHTGASAARVLAQRRADVSAGIDSAATSLDAVASRRADLADLLERAPATLRQTRTTLADVRGTLPVVDPALRELRPAIAPLGELLRRVPPVTRDALPAIASIRRLLPQAKLVLGKLPALDKQASPALVSTTRALKGLLPIVAGLRTYSPDLIAGLFNGFGGAPGGVYDANGHFLRISLEVGPDGLPGLLPHTSGMGGLRTGITARCPGGAEEPTPDGSNPWVPDTSLCNPADDHK